MLIDIEKLSVDHSGIKALEDISFGIAEGDFLGIIGPNGAGKTTTLRMMLGLLRPSSGDSSIDGVSVADNPAQVERVVGFV